MKAKDEVITLCPGITGTLSPIEHEQGWIAVKNRAGFVIATVYVPSIEEPLYSKVLKNLSQQEIQRLESLYGHQTIKEFE